MKTDIFSDIQILVADVCPLDNDELFFSCLQRVSDARRCKALQYYFRRDRNLSLAAGLVLDSLLSGCGLREKDMLYTLDMNKKPRFRDYPDIHFNISHAGHYVVCAMGSIDLGVDIEPIMPLDKDLVHHILSDGELSYLSSLPQDEKSEGFARIWTLKESFLKALGTGLFKSLSDFEIIPGCPTQVSDSCFSHYSFYEFGWQGYAASLCARSCALEKETVLNSIKQLSLIETVPVTY